MFKKIFNEEIIFHLKRILKKFVLFHVKDLIKVIVKFRAGKFWCVVVSCTKTSFWGAPIQNNCPWKRFCINTLKRNKFKVYIPLKGYCQFISWRVLRIAKAHFMFTTWFMISEKSVMCHEARSFLSVVQISHLQFQQGTQCGPVVFIDMNTDKCTYRRQEF